MTYFDLQNRTYSGNMLQSPCGFKFWYGSQGSNGGEMRPAGTDTVVYLAKDACYMMLYYDSTADCRRPHHDTTPVIAPEGEVAEAFFTLSPNPTTGKVSLKIGHTPQSLCDSSPNLREQLITVRGAAGHEVLRQAMPTGQMTAVLDLSGLPSGTYFVTLGTSTETVTQKIILR